MLRSTQPQRVLADFLVLKQPAQSLSTNASTAVGSSSVSFKCQISLSVSIKYLPIRFRTILSQEITRAPHPQSWEASFLLRGPPFCTKGQLNALESSVKPKYFKKTVGMRMPIGFQIQTSACPLQYPVNLLRVILATSHGSQGLDFTPRLHRISECHQFQMMA